MSTIRRRLTVVASTAVLSSAMAVPAVMLAVPAANAALSGTCAHPHNYPPHHCGTIALDSDRVHRGDFLTGDLLDWKHGETVTIDLSGRHCGGPEDVTVNRHGNRAFSYHVHRHCHPGSHVLSAFGGDSGYSDTVAVTVKK